MDTTSATAHPISRRQFVAGTTAALSAAAISPRPARAQSGDKIKLGLIGCGRRGQWIAGLFLKNGNFELVACADYFPDRVDDCGETFAIPAARRYTGLAGYKRLLDGTLDAVVIESPPYFHPLHAADAVAAGKHVYVAKPVAVDVPGCQTVAASGRQASANKRAFLVDFQTLRERVLPESRAASARRRYRPDYLRRSATTIAARRRMREGDAHNDSEERLRHWNFDRALSGDIITEQNIHTLDVMSWIMQRPPLHAVGAGGRKVRIAG